LTRNNRIFRTRLGRGEVAMMIFDKVFRGAVSS
jgi:hypothetical protein